MHAHTHAHTHCPALVHALELALHLHSHMRMNRWDLFQEIILQNPNMRPVFSIFISHEPNMEGSELTVGGYDPEKVLDGAGWQYVPGM